MDGKCLKANTIKKILQLQYNYDEKYDFERL